MWCPHRLVKGIYVFLTSAYPGFAVKILVFTMFRITPFSEHVCCSLFLFLGFCFCVCVCGRTYIISWFLPILFFWPNLIYLGSSAPLICSQFVHVQEMQNGLQRGCWIAWYILLLLLLLLGLFPNNLRMRNYCWFNNVLYCSLHYSQSLCSFGNNTGWLCILSLVIGFKLNLLFCYYSYILAHDIKLVQLCWISLCSDTLCIVLWGSDAWL